VVVLQFVISRPVFSHLRLADEARSWVDVLEQRVGMLRDLRLEFCI